MSGDARAESLASSEAVLTVVVNGEAQTVPAGTSVADVIASLACGPKGIAVAVNADVVPRSAWAATSLREGDHLEVLTAAQGG